MQSNIYIASRHLKPNDLRAELRLRLIPPPTVRGTANPRGVQGVHYGQHTRHLDLSESLDVQAGPSRRYLKYDVQEMNWSTAPLEPVPQSVNRQEGTRPTRHNVWRNGEGDLI